MYRPTIGLEIHAELATSTKMFCDCKNDPDEAQPNVNICPVCLAHPGTLPVPNRAAIEHVFRVGKALGGKLADFSEFDRKSYFYPDIPKGYQISQYAHPFVSGGSLAGVEVTRVHLEEDTARSSHEGEGETSRVDFNRAGIPLMELVTEPVIHDAATAAAFARELQLLLRTLGVSHANLEKGEMRIEANVSVSKDETLGTKVEVKNLNSFRSVERAIAYEVERQSKALEAGEDLVQETRGWNEVSMETFSQRAKEGTADYRYFPEPDIPKILRSDIEEWSDEALVLPELPVARRERYESLGIKEEDAIVIASDPVRARWFDEVLGVLEEGGSLMRRASNMYVNEVGAGELPDAGRFAELVRMAEAGDVSSRGVKEVLEKMSDESPRSVAEREGLLQVSDESALRAAAEEVVRENEEIAREYREGKESALKFLVGQAMKKTKGSGNPQVLEKLLKEAVARG